MNETRTPYKPRLTPEEVMQQEEDRDAASERQFWVEMRAGLLMMASAIERRSGIEEQRCTGCGRKRR